MIKKLINIPEPKINKAKMTLVGKAPLIMHEWSEKAKKQIRDKQQRAAASKKGAREPEKEFESAKIKDKDGNLAIKAIWVKNAIVDSARFVDDLPMTILRGALFVVGDESGLIPLRYSRVEMVEDVVRLSGMGRPADFRYRPYVYGWEADLLIEYDADVLSLEQIVSLLKKAGFSNGLGENRPERSGDRNGTFDVKPYEEKK